MYSSIQSFIKYLLGPYASAVVPGAGSTRVKKFLSSRKDRPAKQQSPGQVGRTSQVKKKKCLYRGSIETWCLNQLVQQRCQWMPLKWDIRLRSGTYESTLQRPAGGRREHGIVHHAAECGSWANVQREGKADSRIREISSSQEVWFLSKHRAYRKWTLR